MSDLQAITAIFRSPEAAVVANQAVQAAEIAARQGLASIQTDARHRKDMVTEAGQAAESAAIGARGERDEGGRPAGRHPQGRADAEASDPALGPQHRIDLIA